MKRRSDGFGAMFISLFLIACCFFLALSIGLWIVLWIGVFNLQNINIARSLEMLYITLTYNIIFIGGGARLVGFNKLKLDEEEWYTKILAYFVLVLSVSGIFGILINSVFHNRKKVEMV